MKKIIVIFLIYCSFCISSGINTKWKICDDFQVNENLNINGLNDQSDASVESLSNGNFVIVWYDERHDVNGDVYGQFYSSDGTPINSNFKINDDIGVNEQNNPQVASDNDGGFVVVWSDSRPSSYSNYSNLYGQKYDQNGIAVGENIKLTENLIQNYAISGNSNSNMSFTSKGELIIVWQFSGLVLMQKFDNNFQPVTNKQIVFESSKRPDEIEIAIDKNDNLVIVWSGYEGSNNRNQDIFLQYFDNDCNKIGEYIKVNDYEEERDLSRIDVAFEENGDFLISWLENRKDRNGDLLYIQHFSKTLQKDGENQKLSNVSGGQPLLYTSSADSLLFLYTSKYDLYISYWTKENGLIGKKVIYKNTDRWISESNLNVTKSGDYILTWGYPDIHFLRFDKDFNKIGNKIQVNDDIGQNEFNSSIAVDSQGNFIITWLSQIGDFYDIYAQMCDQHGNFVNGNFKINEISLDHYQPRPSVAFDSEDNFIVSWIQHINTGLPNIYVQLFDSQCNKIDVNQIINQNSKISCLDNISKNNQKGFIIGWYENDSLYNKYYKIQCINSNGEFYGQNITVNSEPLYSTRCFDIAIAKNSDFVITWDEHKRGSEKHSIYAQYYDHNLNPIGSNFKLLENLENYTCHSSIVTSLKEMYMVWSEDYDYYYLQSFLLDGFVAQGNKIEVIDTVNYSYLHKPAMAVDSSGNFIVGWEDHRNYSHYVYSDIYAQIYSYDGITVGENFKINNNEK